MKPPDESQQRVGAEVRARWIELDILRGLAVISMIANHLGVSSTADEHSRTVWFLTFLGSMAPVLFYLVTGLGYGVGSAGKARKSGEQYMTKFAVLYAADAFLWLGPGRWVGCNFLGFIAISGLLLEWIRRSRRSLQLALGLAALVVLVRFGLGPWVRSGLSPTSDPGWIAFLLGVSGMPGFNYPPCPWLFYPLLGFALGRVAGLNPAQVNARQGRLGLDLLVIAAGFSALGTVLVWRGSTPFRWGSVSVSFFLISLGVVAASLAVSLLMCRGNAPSRLGQLTALGGIRSFAVVPLHYLYRDLTLKAGLAVTDLWGYLVWLAIGVPLCYESSKLVPVLTKHCQKPRLVHAARAAIVAMTVLAAVLVVSGLLNESVDMLVRSTAQLALCVLFGLLSVKAPGRTKRQQAALHSQESEAETVPSVGTSLYNDDGSIHSHKPLL